MVEQKTSRKWVQIDKSKAITVLCLAAASSIVVFSLVLTRGLLVQRSYQSRVINQKSKTLKQLKANNDAAQQLSTKYQDFIHPSTNIIGGLTTGTSDRDGDNAKIVLDALPSKYDFPALATSLDKILKNPAYNVSSITGTDDELNQSAKNAASSQPIEIPFSINVSGNANSVTGIIDILERSVRPIQIIKLDLSGDNNTLSLNISAKTYYQPEKQIQVTTQVIK